MKLPNAVLFDDRLNGEDVKTYGVLMSASWRTDYAFSMTADQIGSLIGKGRDTAERRTRALEKAGWLKVVRNRGLNRANVYRLVVPQECGSQGGNSAAAGYRDSAVAGSRNSAAPLNTQQIDTDRDSLVAELVDNSPCERHGGEGGLLSSGLPRCPGCRRELAGPAF